MQVIVEIQSSPNC